MPLFSSPSGICLMLWFCTNWQSLHFLLGTSVMAAVPAFCVLFFMVVKPACWWTISNVLHICSAAESPSANSWIDTAVKQKLDLQDPVKTNPSAMSQRLCLPEGFKCPRSFLLHICYILYLLLICSYSFEKTWVQLEHFTWFLSCSLSYFVQVELTVSAGFECLVFLFLSGSDFIFITYSFRVCLVCIHHRQKHQVYGTT